MNQVIYTTNLEPITHCDIPWPAWEQLNVFGTTTIRVCDPKQAQPDQLLVLQLEYAKFRGEQYPVITTTQETLALDLWPQPLPGQQRMWPHNP